ncbi:hypothetical protein [Arenibaculum sp.]|jgi:hypothetical protein|uniref:hypothetical protein n=1 Tax=Arenibaculum sp. TaxID=2865862 RepID=UPI002E126D88|nr:hypothetical protein [Arenibaculum sp.]
MAHDERFPQPAALNSADREVQLAIMVPPNLKRAIRRRAESEGVTLRGLLLRALKQAGIVDVDEMELVDRRAVAAQLRSRLYRDAGAD